MKRFIILFALMGVMFAMSPSTAMAGHTGQDVVAATVTPAVISLVLGETTVDYGAVHIPGTNLVPTPASFTATNNGNVAADFFVKGGDSTTGGATPWSIGASIDTDTFVHRASKNADFSSPVTLTVDNQLLASGVAGSGGVETVYLKLDTPTISTVDDQQSLPVTIVATAA